MYSFCKIQESKCIQICIHKIVDYIRKIGDRIRKIDGVCIQIPKMIQNYRVVHSVSKYNENVTIGILLYHKYSFMFKIATGKKFTVHSRENYLQGKTF